MTETVNPIVVFVNPTHEGLGSLRQDEYVPLLMENRALGVCSNGRVEVAKSSKGYSLILLDDQMFWNCSSEPLCAVCCNKPLLIVEHESSDHNSSYACPQRWINFWGITSPVVCKTFKHKDNDGVFEHLKAILRRGDGARDATETLRRSCSVAILGVLEGLVALRQFLLLCDDCDSTVKAQVEKLEKEYLDKVPDFKKFSMKEMGKTCAEFPDQIKKIQKFAAELISHET